MAEQDVKRYIDRTILVNINDPVTNVGDINIACFDYIKDGIIDNQDLVAWKQWMNKNKDDFDFNVFADVNGDGCANAKDYAMINKFKGKSKHDIYTNI